MSDRCIPTLSVVFPVYDEEGNLPVLYDRVLEAIRDTGMAYELVFVDNGSTDGSLLVIKGLAERDTRVRYVSLSRNFGHQGGLVAGLSYAQGDAVITTDADLQHPPSLIPEMVRLWREGYEVVYTSKRNTHLGGLKGLQVRLFYSIMSKVSGLKLSFGQSDFRLLDRKLVDVLLDIPEYRKFLRGTVEWMGFRQTGVEYEVTERYTGESKFSYGTLISFALDGILAFSTLPLRWVAAMGALVSSVALLYAIIVVVLGILSATGGAVSLPPGWATVASAITFFGGVQLLAIGIVGEYLGRVYEQTKGRPVFIVREMSDREDSVKSQIGVMRWSR